MITGHVFIATSVDGFIARSDGGIDWLLKGWPEVGHDYGFSEFTASVDGLIMGRSTSEKVLTFETWLYSKPVVVLSRTLRQRDLRDDLAGRVRISASEPKDVLTELEREGWKRAYVDGGQVIQSFLREGLIEDMVLTRIPILLGEGLPLFGPSAGDIKLTHLETTTHTSGFVQSHYAVQR